MNRLLIAGLAAVLLTLPGCSDSLSRSSAPAPASTAPVRVDQALRAKLPAKVAAANKAIVGTDPTYAPNEFLDADGHTVIGSSAELLQAALARLGVSVEWAPSPFDGVVAGVESGKYDLAMSSLTINPERTRQGVMVAYFSAGTRWAVAAGNPRGFSVTDGFCGHPVAVQTGTYQEQELLPRMRATCPAGRPLTILSFQSQAEATASLASGKADAMVADSPVIDYAAKESHGAISPASEVQDSAPYGFFLPKGAQGFAEALAGALAAMKADGTYDAILARWGVQAGGIGAYDVKTG